MVNFEIIKHKDTIPVCGPDKKGDILYPFSNWFSTSTGDGWYSRATEEFYTTKIFYPLVAISQNPWDALQKLGIEHSEFKQKVEYQCPYNSYIHFWSVPLLIFTKDIQTWIEKYRIPRYKMYLDQGWVDKFYPRNTKNGFPFTKIHRALLGPGYTSKNLIDDGYGHLYDALIALNNQDMIGCKVWVWFARSK